MDMLSFFEQKLATEEQSLETAEYNWDQRAETFHYNQVNGSTHYADAVPRLLEQKGILGPSSRVLDIGAGSGRYAIPIAKRAQSVRALDLSTEMLQFLQREVDKHGLNNVATVKSAWPTSEDIGEVDVAFSAMCPATRSVEALQAMSNVAGKYGVMCQFTASADTVVEALKSHELIDGTAKGPHNDRDILQAYFNILWELGYEPEISYLNDTFKVNMIVNDAFDTYKKRYGHIEAEQLNDVLQTLKQEDKDNIEVMKYTTLAVISWEV